MCGVIISARMIVSPTCSSRLLSSLCKHCISIHASPYADNIRWYNSCNDFPKTDWTYHYCCLQFSAGPTYSSCIYNCCDTLVGGTWTGEYNCRFCEKPVNSILGHCNGCQEDNYWTLKVLVFCSCRKHDFSRLSVVKNMQTPFFSFIFTMILRSNTNW